MKTCEEIRERAWPFLDGELDPAEAAVVSSHLERCPSCARAFDRARAFLAAMARAGEEPAPRSLRARVEALLDSAETGAPRPAAGAPEGPTTAWSSAGGASRVLRRVARFGLPLAAVLAALLLFRPWDGSAPREALAARGFAADHAAHAAARPSDRPFRAGEEPPGDPPRLADGRPLGLSRCVVDGRVYAHWTWAVDGAVVSAFVPVDGDLPDRTGGPVTIDGTAVHAVRKGGRGAVLVSTDLRSESLAGLVPDA